MGMCKLFIYLSLITFIRAEERLSWFTSDRELKKSIFVPDNLPEGKEENRVLPWVFHDDDGNKEMQLKCMMRGYNASNNPSDYQNARWSHPGFDDSQVDKSAPAVKGEENGVPYAIWTISIDTSAADAGKKWATCEFQQGDFPLSTDFKFLIFKKISDKIKEENRVLSYSLGEHLDEKDINQQIEEDIKRQISEHFKMTSNNVDYDGQIFNLIIPLPIKPTVKPTVKPTIKPTVKPTVRPTTTPPVKPTTKAPVKPTTKAPVKPDVKPDVKPPSKPLRPRKPCYYETNQIVMDTVIQCDEIPKCYSIRQDEYEKTCPSYQLIEIKVHVCSSAYQRHLQQQYCYCTNARIVERRITSTTNSKFNLETQSQITKPLLQEPFYYYSNQLAVERVIQCDPYPTPYCYWERKEWIETKYPNYQRIEVWSSNNSGKFDLRYCYCTNAKIVEYTSVLGKYLKVYLQ